MGSGDWGGDDWVAGRMRGCAACTAGEGARRSIVEFFSLYAALKAPLFSVALAVGRCGGENSLRRRRRDQVGRGPSTAEGLALLAQDPSSLRMTIGGDWVAGRVWRWAGGTAGEGARRSIVEFFSLYAALKAPLFSVALAVGWCGGENSLRRRRRDRVGMGSFDCGGSCAFAQDPSSLRMTISDGRRLGRGECGAGRAG
jgi:hypothetical protein